ncbi:hypothetical protein [Pseudophaeobacter sp. EL27]|uniref:hypothetical protein n=1 Tax=Pseudophaeobacter sp. EL27 TaxID=2107580 RepID=UPI0020B15536|nr:hypothetical protein [Pseudophaeobacter sp. EL27]
MMTFAQYEIALEDLLDELTLEDAQQLLIRHAWRSLFLVSPSFPGSDTPQGQPVLFPNFEAKYILSCFRTLVAAEALFWDSQALDQMTVTQIRDSLSGFRQGADHFSSQTLLALKGAIDLVDPYTIEKSRGLALHYLQRTAAPEQWVNTYTLADGEKLATESGGISMDPLYPSQEATSQQDPTHKFDIVHFENELHLNGPAWNFWKSQYAARLAGQRIDFSNLRTISKIQEIVWEAGPEAVAKEIERIQAEMLAEKLPLAERIEANPDTGKFRAIPISVENPTTLSALLSQIEDALEDCLGGHNGLAEHSGSAKKLNRVLTKYKDDPQNAELTLTRVAGSLRNQLHDTRELPDNEDNLALLNAVEEGVRGIRANHPEVAKNREQLAQQAIHALTPEDKDLLQQALPVLEQISEPELADDFGTDIPELINDTLLPLPDGAPPLPGADTTTRIFSRISKMALLIQNGKDLAQKGAKTFDSGIVKSVRLAGLAISVTGGIGGIVFALVKVGLKILGVL